MAQRDGTIQHGNRVFRIDEECYIIYLGSEGHGVRPFLRIGTSPVLPQRIRRHIGSVVITDHLTGNLFEEDACLDPASPRTTRYVGGQKLVDAVKHFVHREHIPSQALEPPVGEKPGKGGQVVYYEDGNVRVFLDGHRLFDLNERERADRHTVFRTQRVSEIISASRGVYRSQEFSGTGFVVAPGGAVLHFFDGNLFLAGPHTERSLASWAWYGIDPAGVVGIDAGTEPRRMSELYKFRLTSRRAVAVSDATTPRPRDRIHDAVTVFAAAGIDQRDFPHPSFPADVPTPAPDAGTLVLPAGATWYGDVTPPLLPGVPYRYDDYPSELEFRHLLTAELRHEIDAAAAPDDALAKIAGRTITQPIDRVLVALWLWNRRSGPGEHTKAKLEQAGTLLSEAFADRDIPIVAILRSDHDNWYVRFRPRDGLTRSAIADNDRARKKLTPLLETEDRSAQFQAERNRLTAFLDELLAAHRVTAAPPVEGTAAASSPTEDTASPDTAPTTAKETAPSSSNTAHPGKTVGRGNAKAPGKTGPTGQTASTHKKQPENEEPEKTEEPDPAEPESRSGTPRPVDADKRDRHGERGLMRPAPVVIGIILLLLAGGAFWLIRSSGADGATQVSAGAAPSGGANGATTGPADNTLTADAPDGPGDAVSAGGDAPDAGDNPASTGGSVATDSTASADGTEGSGTAGPDVPETPDTTAADRRWSVVDVLRVTNWIAAENGYRRIGVNEFADRPDPDWIFPGNTFRLPDGQIHAVIAGETLWEISTDFLNRTFIASDMELSHFRDLIDSEEYPVEELQN